MGWNCIFRSEDKAKSRGFCSLLLRCLFAENHRGSLNLKDTQTPTSRDLATSVVSFHPNARVFPLPHPTKALFPFGMSILKQPSSCGKSQARVLTRPVAPTQRGGPGWQGPGMFLTSSLQRQIPTDRAFTSEGPTQICFEPKASGQQDQRCVWVPVGILQERTASAGIPGPYCMLP